ncbi:MAG: hypothetical protein N3B15_08980 [Planctomycetota bacterium]|nr:hypothetical protein [Planctomycetota bacterium]
MTTPEPAPWRGRLHDTLVVLLPALRPWCWDGAPGQLADLLWQLLAVGALLIAACEHAVGWRPCWQWGGWRGAVALALLGALLPTLLIAPEPAPSWCRWSGWVACLAAAAYVLQVLPGRERLLWAGLGAGAAITASLTVLQPALVFPEMRQALAAGSAAFDAVPGEPGAIAERLARGGAYGTFTLANHCAAYLALLLALAIGSAWRTPEPRARLAAALLALLLTAALAATEAKGGWLALAGAAALAWWLAWPGRWWRWLPLPLALGGALALWASGWADASIAVRLGYWRAAVALANEGPQGLGGYAAHQARVLLPGEEPTRYAHNELLEAAVAGGWYLAPLMALALLALGWPRAAPAALAPAAPRPWSPLLAGALAAALLYAALLGAFDGNLGWWPGGERLPGLLGWALVLAGAAALSGWLLAHAAPPPPLALNAGLAAIAAKALIDFDWHAGGVIGSALLAAPLAAPARSVSPPPLGARRRLAPLLLALLAGLTVAGNSVLGLRLSEAERLLLALRTAQRDAGGAQLLAAELGLGVLAPPAALRRAAVDRIWDLAWGSPSLRSAALDWDWEPQRPETWERVRQLRAAAPGSARVALQFARAALARGERAAALAAAEEAARLAPTTPRVLAEAAEILAAAGAADAAAALAARAAELEPLVHPTLRPAHTTQRLPP